MNLVEKLESWRWIRPIPSKPPKKEDLKKFDSRKKSDKKSSTKKFSTFASHFNEWQKEQVNFMLNNFNNKLGVLGHFLIFENTLAYCKHN